MIKNVVLFVTVLLVLLTTRSEAARISSLSFEALPAAAKCTQAPGVSGQAILLTADTEYPDEQFGQPLSNAFTVSVWGNVLTYPDDGSGKFDKENPMTLWCFINQENDRDVICRINKQKIEFVFLYGKTWITIGTQFIIDKKEWFNCCVVSDGQSVKVYVNGVLQGSEMFSLNGKWRAVSIGRWGSNRKFKGLIDEFLVFDQALTDSEISKIVSSQSKSVRIEKPSEIKKIEQSYRYGQYPALKVEDNVLHPFHDGLHISATIAPWTGKGKNDIIVSAYDNKFGSRNAVYSRVGTDEKELPIYDPGTTIYDLPGGQHQAIVLGNGMFDIVANGQWTPYGRDNIVYMKNTGSVGNPQFDSAVPLQIDGKFVTDAVSGGVRGWVLGDVDGDGVLDLLFHEVTDKGFLPDNTSFWSGSETPNKGKGRGYDIEGQWLGGRTTTRLMWAKGIANSSGVPQFANPQIVHFGEEGFAVQWRSFPSNRSTAVMDIDGRKYIIVSGNIDRIFALEVRVDAGKLYCDRAMNLLADDASMFYTYYPVNLTVCDIDDDGRQEMVIDGNPGRMVVFKGDKAGQFKEIGYLEMRGGYLAVDTLTTPVRVDWDNDGYPDVITGDSSGFMTFWLGTKRPEYYGEPVAMTLNGKLIHHQAGLTGSIQGPTEIRWGYLQPTIGNWDNDGKPDLIANDIKGEMYIYKGADGGCDFKQRVRLTYNDGWFKCAWRARPAIIDSTMNYDNTSMSCLLYLDWDGELSVAVPQSSGGTDFTRTEKLKYDNGGNILLSGPCGHWGRTKLSVTDWDGDGDWDVILGTLYAVNQYFLDEKDNPRDATPCLLENVGSSAKPVFAKGKSFKLKDGSLIKLGGHNASVWPTDIDNDGKLDLIVGAEDGKVYIFNRNDITW